LTVAEERERRRIAADLHDHVQQSLASARLQLAAARKPQPHDKLTAALDAISESLRETLQETRQLVFDLSSPSMNEIGLGAAISEWLHEQVERRHGLKTEFADELRDASMDEDVRAILFRSVRELLANAIKHARATTISVALRSENGYLKITVQDDGVGCDPDTIWDTMGYQGGFGLFSIRERMSDLGGELEIASEPGKGCRVVLTAPLRV
jgi:signal transduction histidine kinase